LKAKHAKLQCEIQCIKQVSIASMYCMVYRALFRKLQRNHHFQVLSRLWKQGWEKSKQNANYYLYELCSHTETILKFPHGWSLSSKWWPQQFFIDESDFLCPPTKTGQIRKFPAAYLTMHTIQSVWDSVSPKSPIDPQVISTQGEFVSVFFSSMFETCNWQ